MALLYAMRASLFVACVSAVWLSTSLAQDPATRVAVAHHITDGPLSRGFVLLRNQSVLAGAAIQRGNEVVVRRDDGSEIVLKRPNVLCWGKSIRDLYRYRVDHRTSNRVDVHLDDAEWCLRNAQLDLVVQELRLVKSVDANNARAARIQRQLYHAVVAKTRQQQSVKQAIPGESKKRNEAGDPIALASYESERRARRVGDDAHASFPAETVRTFAKSVQPILLNRCGSCHGHNSDLKWQMRLPPIGSRPSAAMTHENLGSISKYISFEVPLESEIRLRALDGHAGIRNALSVRDSAATRAIDAWLESAEPAGAPLALAKQRYARAESVDRNLSESGSVAASSKAMADGNQAELDKPAEDDTLERLPKVANPFDPEIFNRRVHSNESR